MRKGGEVPQVCWSYFPFGFAFAVFAAAAAIISESSSAPSRRDHLHVESFLTATPIQAPLVGMPGMDGRPSCKYHPPPTAALSLRPLHVRVVTVIAIPGGIIAMSLSSGQSLPSLPARGAQPGSRLVVVGQHGSDWLGRHGSRTPWNTHRPGRESAVHRRQFRW